MGLSNERTWPPGGLNSCYKFSPLLLKPFVCRLQFPFKQTRGMTQCKENMAWGTTELGFHFLQNGKNKLNV